MDEIQAEVKKLDDESKALKQELFKMAWFMRGAVTLEQAYQLDLMDRDLLGGVIKENLETAAQTGVHVF